MNHKTYFRLIFIGILFLVSGSMVLMPGSAQENIPQKAALSSSVLATAFTYQGQLTEDSTLANGLYDFEFKLFDDVSSGAQVGSAFTNKDVMVSNGLFTVEIDFGSVFDGAALWLEVAVRPGSSTGSYTTLNPRQNLTAAPYALYSQNAPWDGLSGVPAGFADNVDNNTTYTAGSGLTLSANQFSLTAGYRLPQACANGQIAEWNGSAWACSAENSHDHWGQTWFGSGAGLTLTGDQFGILADGGSYGVYGSSASAEGFGLYGYTSATNGPANGVFGQTLSTGGTGITGWASAATGLTNGVYGYSASENGTGVAGYASAGSGYTTGIRGQSDSSTFGIGVDGLATATSGAGYGVRGVSNSSEGRGLFGQATSLTGTTYGIYGQSESSGGTGVYGYASATSGYTSGVYGQSDSNTYSAGVTGVASAADGTTYGIWGESASNDGRGVAGRATATSGETVGVYGRVDSNTNDASGVYGYASASSGSTVGVAGWNDSPAGIGVRGYAIAISGTNFGVVGQTNSPSGYAGYFVGDVNVLGDFSVSGTKAFIIDHPLDPQNQYLYHYNIESSEVVNQYSGNALLDDTGTALVQLPDWFEAINADFRYQLTPIGASMPNLYIAQEIQSNTFQIAGGEPGMKVSWLVTALRSDPYLQQNPHPVEVEKLEDDRGTYLLPELYDQPQEKGLDYQRFQDALESE